MLTTLIKYLNDIHPMSEKLVSELWDHAKIKDYKKDEIVLKEGVVANYTSWVLKGALRSYYFKEDEEITTKFIQEGAPITSIYSYYGRRPGNENIIL